MNMKDVWYEIISVTAHGRSLRERLSGIISGRLLYLFFFVVCLILFDFELIHLLFSFLWVCFRFQAIVVDFSILICFALSDLLWFLSLNIHCFFILLFVYNFSIFFMNDLLFLNLFTVLRNRHCIINLLITILMLFLSSKLLHLSWFFHFLEFLSTHDANHNNSMYKSP